MAEIVVKLVNGELAGKTAQSIAKEVNAAAAALKKAEIGTKEWVEANKKLEEAKKLQEDLKKQIQGTAEASDILKEAFNKLPGAQYFNQIGESFGMMKKGVGGLISQFGMLKTAIASTGIGLLILALASLISYFTTTQEGIDKITSVTRPLKAIFEALKNVLNELGQKTFKRLQEAIENPKQAFIELGEVIKENIINRFKAVLLFAPAIKKIFSGDISGGFKDLGNAVLQASFGVEKMIDKVVDLGKAVVNVVDEAIEKGKRLDALTKAIERAEIDQITRSEKLKLLLKEQKDIVEDSNRTWDERRQAAANALQIQQTLLNSELALLDKRIEKMKLEHSMGDVSREQEKELAELLAQRLKLQAETTEQSIEWKKKITEFNAAQAAEEKAINENLRDLRVEAMKEGMEKEIEAIILGTQRKWEALRGTEEQIFEQEVLLTEIQEQQIQAVKDKYAAEAAAKDQKAKDEQKKRDEQAAKEKEALARQQAAFQREMQDLEIGMAQESVSFAGELAGRAAKNAQEAKKVQKGFALIDLGINLQKELSANAVAAAANPLNATTFGAAGVAQLAKSNLASLIRFGIGTAKVIAFGKGGFTGGLMKGPSHAQGGIPIEVEGGEFIFSRKATAALGVDHLNSINNFYTQKYATGGPVNPIASSSPTSTNSPSLPDPTAALSEMKTWIGMLIEAQDQRIDRIQVINNVGDTAQGIQTLNEIQTSADV